MNDLFPWKPDPVITNNAPPFIDNIDGDKSLIIGFSTKVLASCPVSLIKAVPRLPTPTPNVCRTPTIGELAASKEHLIVSSIKQFVRSRPTVR
jgi:hypothetical protein